jgi:hypothetical protein
MDSNFMLQRANHLKSQEANSIHVLVSPTTVMVALNNKTIPGITAQKVIMDRCGVLQ